METDRETLLDRLLSAYADRVAAGRAAEQDDLLAEAPAELRPELRRLFALVALDEAGPREPVAPLVPGLVLGGCKLIEELGRGGMASVWLAEQQELHRQVAVKVLRPGLALDPRHAQRFRREALAVARLDHPHVVRIHEVGRERGHLFLVMERIEGGTLARELAQAAPRDERAWARRFAPVARALAAAHAAGIVHRDVKPSNLLVRRDGALVVADFGLAKGDGDLATSLTGGPLGTPWYMSPEQVEQTRAAVDARTDLWSLGVTLYEALAGRRPFEGPTAIALFDAIRHATPPPLQTVAPHVSAAAAAVVAKAMARDPAARYATAADFAADLEALADGRPVAARAPALREVAAALVAARQRGEPFEWRSARAWRGRPLLHVAFGRRGERKVARGVVAIGDRAVGLLAIGTVARGVVALGNVAIGAVAFGAFGCGGLALGGGALGVVALGGVAVGGFALGGLAVGAVAIGGFAAGGYALGGKTFAYEWVNGADESEAGRRFFTRFAEWGRSWGGGWMEAIRTRLARGPR
ncbi:MAG: serine/threonine protein kinase [Planctomycetes bacterium]|nr:serine/threonine protein kinase [Planctomycetota bacterium]